jgi:hypothetical protein
MGTGRASQKGPGTAMYLIALAAEAQAIWNGAAHGKTPRLVRVGGTEL